MKVIFCACFYLFCCEGLREIFTYETCATDTKAVEGKTRAVLCYFLDLKNVFSCVFCCDINAADASTGRRRI